jgi:hypothetical protein
MLTNKQNTTKIDSSDLDVKGINHAQLQQVIVVVLGLLMLAVFATSCTSQKSCSAYQSVEQVD